MFLSIISWGVPTIQCISGTSKAGVIYLRLRTSSLWLGRALTLRPRSRRSPGTQRKLLRARYLNALSKYKHKHTRPDDTRTLQTTDHNVQTLFSFVYRKKETSRAEPAATLRYTKEARRDLFRRPGALTFAPTPTNISSNSDPEE